MFDENGERIGQRGPGDVVETRILGAQAPARNTVAAIACRTVVLAPAALRLLEESDSALALRLYRYILAANGPFPEPTTSNSVE